MLAAIVAMLGSSAGTAPAAAQYGYDDAYRPRRGYDDRRYEYGRPRARRGGSLCVTARGNCPYPPSPLNAPCACEIPGFGIKRGAIGG